MWHQQELRLAPRSRGFHLITDEIATALAELREVKVGLLHLQLLHTSASLTLNENADPDCATTSTPSCANASRGICPISATSWRGRTTCPPTSAPACSAPN